MMDRTSRLQAGLIRPSSFALAIGALEKVSDLLLYIRGGGADIDSIVRWGLLHLRLHRCQMSLQIYAGRFGEVCSEPHERLLIVVEGSYVRYGCSRGGWRSSGSLIRVTTLARGESDQRRKPSPAARTPSACATPPPQWTGPPSRR